MRAEVLVEFKGAADGEVYPRLFQVGEVIEGALARSEVEYGRAKALDGAPRNKSEGENRGPFPTGGEKLSSSPPVATASTPPISRRRKGGRG